MRVRIGANEMVTVGLDRRWYRGGAELREVSPSLSILRHYSLALSDGAVKEHEKELIFISVLV
jgi:hypothetical protein